MDTAGPGRMDTAGPGRMDNRRTRAHGHRRTRASAGADPLDVDAAEVTMVPRAAVAVFHGPHRRCRRSRLRPTVDCLGQTPR